MGGMFSNLGSGLVNNMFGGGQLGQLANNVIMPGVNRMTGGGSLQNIGSRMFGGQQGQQTPQQQVDQSQQGGGFGQPGMGQMPGQIGQPGGQPGMFEPNQEQNQQYFQQMHQNMDGMNENMDGLSQALQQIEGMQMPGGQYPGSGGGFTPGGGGGKFGSIGLGKQYDFSRPPKIEYKTF